MCPSLRLNAVLFLLACLLVAIHSQECRFTCPSTATCIAGECVCNSDTPAGIGRFYCFDPTSTTAFEYGSCLVFGDPHIHNFNGGLTRFPLPCRHRLTHYDPHSNCGLEIYASTELTPDGYIFEREVELDIYGDHSNGFTSIHIRISAISATYRFDQGADNPINNDGSVIDMVFGNLQLKAQYDTVDEIWKVWSAPDNCDFTVAFRPFVGDGDIADQARIPGIAIIGSKDPSYFSSTPISRLPESMCSAVDEPVLIPSGLQDPRLALALIYLGPSFGVTTYNAYDLQCSDSRLTLTNQCTSANRVTAMNACGPFLLAKQAKCLTIIGTHVHMDVFVECLTLVCTGATDCSIIRQQVVDQNCEVPPAFDDYCNSLVR